MEKDYLPSEKYSKQEIEAMQVPYAMQDSCVDSFCDYRSCVTQSRWNFVPFFNNIGPCRQLYDRWIVCQSNREFEIKERRRSQLMLTEETSGPADAINIKLKDFSSF
jgi:hypothetical protein